MEQVCLEVGGGIVGIVASVIAIASMVANLPFVDNTKWWGKIIAFLAVNLHVDSVKK